VHTRSRILSTGLLALWFPLGLCTSFALAQPSQHGPSTVRRDVHHDISPPLRDLIAKAQPPLPQELEAEPVGRIPLPQGLSQLSEQPHTTAHGSATAVRGRTDGGCDRQGMRAIEHRTGVCVQCDSSAVGLVRVSDGVARRRPAAWSFDAECAGWAVTWNMEVVPNSNGSIDAFASNLTQLILGISSYFAP
jgi:hypothetical protein